MKPLPITIEELSARYSKGESAAALGLLCGVSGDTISARLRRAGVVLRSKAEAAVHPVKSALLSEYRRGRKAWNKGLTKADSRVSAYAARMAGREVSQATRAKLAAAKFKGVPVQTTCSDCGKAKGASKRTRCVSCAQRLRAKLFPNSQAGKPLSVERKAALMAGSGKQRAMTKPEKRMVCLLDSLFGSENPFRYVGFGDEALWIRKGQRLRRPDFAHKVKRQIIEVFGRYWHPPEHESQAISDYAAAGWQCLVVWEDEFEAAPDRILRFVAQGENRADNEPYGDSSQPAEHPRSRGVSSAHRQDQSRAL